jgi:Ca-activated chloride channel family protein
MNKRGFLIGTLLLVLTVGARAQQESRVNQQGEEKITIATNLVTVNVIVTDRDGRYLTGLRRDQFEVYDEKVKQQIAHFSNKAAPVSVGIVCEIHNRTPEKTRALLIALKRFTEGLRNDDDFFFMAFGTEGSVTSDFVPTADQVLEHLASVKPGGASSFYDAVYTSADRLRRRPNLKKALLIVSDGEDDNSRTSYQQLRNRLREFDVQVYSIGIANPATDQSLRSGAWMYEDVSRQTTRRPFPLNSDAGMGRAVLAEMARVSGGTTYSPESENEPELLGILTQISLELREQYTIGFYPAGERRDNDWHRILVKLNSGRALREVVLSYRQAYRRINR